MRTYKHKYQFLWWVGYEPHWFLQISWSGAWCDSHKILNFWAIFNLVILIKRILVKKKRCIYLPKSHHGCNLRCIWLYRFCSQFYHYLWLHHSAGQITHRIPAIRNWNFLLCWFKNEWLQDELFKILSTSDSVLDEGRDLPEEI